MDLTQLLNGNRSHIGKIASEFVAGQVVGTFASAAIAAALNPRKGKPETAIAIGALAAPVVVGVATSGPVKDYMARHSEQWPFLAGLATGIVAGTVGAYFAGEPSPRADASEAKPNTAFMYTSDGCYTRL